MMKKFFAFVSAAMFVAALTVACGNKNAATEQNAEENTVEAAAEESACCAESAVESSACSESDANAMLAAAKEAGQAICNCTNGDAASIESCMKSVLAASYAQYEGNTEFAEAVKAEINNCIKAKATEAATEAVNEGVKAGANALAKKLNEKK